ncbi:MAG: DUF4270 family protein [Saprospiraceae bacterium]|nr:DUF4270 family protein [Saprospiraceae bacterium]
MNIFFARAYDKWLLLYILLSIIAFIACNKKEDLGIDFFPEETFDINVIDTFSLTVSSVLYDSLITDRLDRLLVGSHLDAQLGRITSYAYCQVGLTEGDSYYLEKKNMRYDSLTLMLKYDGYSYYDTSNLQTLYIYRVSEDIEIAEEDTALYNKSNFFFTRRPLGQISFYPRPNSGGELEIKLDDNLGLAIYNLAIERADELANNDNFQEYFKGIVLAADTSQSAAFIGFSTESEMRLYYTDYSELPITPGKYVFPIDGGLYFNRIETNRSGTNFAELTPITQELYSYKSDNQSFIQGSEGVAMRVEIPHLTDLLADGNDFLISKAVLEFYPITKDSGNNHSLPSQLNVFWANKNNEILVYNNYAATLYTDEEYGRDTRYEVDITEFIQYQLQVEGINHNTLIFELSEDYNTSVNRVIIGDAKHERGMSLKVYIISIK